MNFEGFQRYQFFVPKKIFQKKNNQMEQSRENTKDEKERSIRSLATSYRWTLWRKIWCY